MYVRTLWNPEGARDVSADGQASDEWKARRREERTHLHRGSGLTCLPRRGTGRRHLGRPEWRFISDLLARMPARTDGPGMTVPGSTGSVASDINVAIAKKAQDVAKQQGNAAVALIQDAVAISKSSRGAVSAVPGPAEAGRSLDIRA